MVALAPSDEEGRFRLVRAVEHHGLRVLDIANEREVFGDEDAAQIDGHPAANLRTIEPEAQTICAPGEPCRSVQASRGTTKIDRPTTIACRANAIRGLKRSASSALEIG